MAYREPGVYTNIINTRPLTGSSPNLIPLIIGEGPKFQDKTTVPIVRAAAGDNDTLPSTKVTAITRVYTITNGVETTIIITGNYALSGNNIIAWQAAGPNKPASGVTYYVDYEARPEATQYLPVYITSFEALKTMYYGQLMRSTTGGADNTLNPAYLGAYLALEAGCQGVYVIQVEPADKVNYAVVIDTDIVTALAKAATLDDAYYVVPMTSSATAVGLVITHCTTMSTTIERKERICFISKNFSTPAAASGLFTSGELDSVVSAVSSLVNKRVRVPFITTATKVLSNGTEYSLGAEYVCAALAGLSAVIPVSKALTRQSLFGFNTFKNVFSLTRLDKNRVAAAGIIVFEQPGGVGSNINIRHGVTTNMTNAADKEHSVVVSVDYTAKYVRSLLEGYIGKFNIDAFLLSKISGSLTGAKGLLVSTGVLRDFKYGAILQDELNPDSLLINISVLPLYPCNYIDVSLLIE